MGKDLIITRGYRWGLALLLSVIVPVLIYMACFMISGFMENVLEGSTASNIYAFAMEAGLMAGICLVPGVITGRLCGWPGMLLLPSTCLIFLAKIGKMSSTDYHGFIGLMWLAGGIHSLLFSISLGVFLRKRALRAGENSGAAGAH